jgi:hypothetical protein
LSAWRRNPKIDSYDEWATAMSDAGKWLKIVGQIAKEAFWAPLAVFTAHYLVTKRLDHEPYVDPVMHFAGGAAVAFLFWRSIAGWQRYKGACAVANPVLLAFGLALLVGIAWELMEYLLFVYRGTTHWWTLLNTLRDLALDAGGAALLLIWLRRRDMRVQQSIAE